MSEPFHDPSTTLTGQRVELRPMAPDDAAAMVEAASDGRLWESRFSVIPDQGSIDDYIRTALAGRDAGTMLPFVVVDLRTGRVVGSTRYWKMDARHRKLEIGSTWLARAAQRTGINTEAKYLLLRHAFESLGTVRVQLSTDELNVQSRQAILGIGATQEGILRHERIMPDGRKRNTVRFSVTDDEWPAVKALLTAKLARAGGS